MLANDAGTALVGIVVDNDGKYVVELYVAGMKFRAYQRHANPESAASVMKDVAEELGLDRDIDHVTVSVVPLERVAENKRQIGEARQRLASLNDFRMPASTKPVVKLLGHGVSIRKRPQPIVEHRKPTASFGVASGSPETIAKIDREAYGVWLVNVDSWDSTGVPASGEIANPHTHEHFDWFYDAANSQLAWVSERDVLDQIGNGQHGADAVLEKVREAILNNAQMQAMRKEMLDPRD